MTDYPNNTNENKPVLPRQDAWQNPYILEGGTPPTGTAPRHRRSDRYEDAAPIQPIQPTQPVRPFTPVPGPAEKAPAYPETPAGPETQMYVTPAPNYARETIPPVQAPAPAPVYAPEAVPPVQAPAPAPVYPPETKADEMPLRPAAPVQSAPFPEEYGRPAGNVAFDDDDYMEADEEDEEYNEVRIWPRVLLALVALLLVMAVALYFIPNAGPLQPVKDKICSLVNGALNSASPKKTTQPQVFSIESEQANAPIGSLVTFRITTNQNINNLYLEQADGERLNASIAQTADSDGDTKVWQAVYVFAQPFEGPVYAAYQDGNGRQRTDKSIQVKAYAPVPTPAQTQMPIQTVTQAPVVTFSPAPTKAPTPAPTQVPAVIVTTQAPTQAPTLVPQTAIPVIPTWAPAVTAAPVQATEAPTPVPTMPPTPAPTQAPTPVPTMPPAPTATPIPRLTASGDIDFKLTDTVFIGPKAQEDFQRKKGYVAPHPDQYGKTTAAGVLTFRGDNFRRNAAWGNAEIESGSMSILWQSPVGSLRTEDNGTLWGVGWTGQPVIIKWSKEVREMMNLYDDKKATSALKEVIFGSQDGKIYFLELSSGQATRDPINVGFPLKGSVAVDTQGRPMLAVGQGISKLANGKTGSIGLHVYNLNEGKPFFMINGRKTDNQKQYFTNGAFDGTPLFIYGNDAMVVAGENGLLYTVDLNPDFQYPKADKPDIVGSLALSPEVTYLRTKAAEEKDAQVPVESSVAMYDKYIYMADTYGVLRCVDSDTMKTVWAMDNGDNTDAAIALDMDGDMGVSLYTGNTAYSRLGSKKDVTIRRLDALSGEEVWSYAIKCEYNKSQLSGCKASPIVGQHSIDNLVIFTVNMVEEGGSRMVALHKDTGAVVWTYDMTTETVSSPVAVYNNAGDAWIIQADGDGCLHMLSGLTGSLCSTLDLGGKVEGSPAVYDDILVIGTSSKDAQMYAIKLQ